MAGRLRTQLSRINDLGSAVAKLTEQLWDAAPTGVLSTEIALKRMRDEPVDDKTALWNDAWDGLAQAEDALDQLYNMVEARIRKLPTYRPPQATALPAVPSESGGIATNAVTNAPSEPG